MQHTSAGGGFFSKIKENYSSKLAGLSIAGGPYVEKDGSSEDNTLIHNAFVKYYDSKGLPYPDWLGVKTFQSQQQQQQQGYVRTQYQQDYSQSKYQPVRQDNTFNNSYNARQTQQQQQQQQQHQQQTNGSDRPNSGGYQRSSSRLQDLYNKSRQQSIPGQGYNTSNSWSHNR